MRDIKKSSAIFEITLSWLTAFLASVIPLCRATARLAVDVVAEDIAHAGFWGGFVPNFDDLTATGAPDLDLIVEELLHERRNLRSDLVPGVADDLLEIGR